MNTLIHIHIQCKCIYRAINSQAEIKKKYMKINMFSAVLPHFCPSHRKWNQLTVAGTTAFTPICLHLSSWQVPCLQWAGIIWGPRMIQEFTSHRDYLPIWLQCNGGPCWVATWTSWIFTQNANQSWLSIIYYGFKGGNNKHKTHTQWFLANEKGHLGEIYKQIIYSVYIFLCLHYECCSGTQNRF